MRQTMPDPDLVAPPEKLSFLDRQTLALPRPLTAAEAWSRMNARPLPGLALAFRLRDAISARFGVEPIGGLSGRPAGAPRPGDKLDFFLIERAEPGILTLSARDRHLDTITCITTSDTQLAITSSVVTKNRFGQLYMLPVAPAHRLIVKTLLKRLSRELQAKTGQAAGNRRARSTAMPASTASSGPSAQGRNRRRNARNSASSATSG